MPHPRDEAPRRGGVPLRVFHGPDTPPSSGPDPLAITFRVVTSLGTAHLDARVWTAAEWAWLPEAGRPREAVQLPGGGWLLLSPAAWN